MTINSSFSPILKSNRVRKIALILPDLNIGGAENVFVNLANFFVAKGISVDFVVMNDEGDLKEKLDSRVFFVSLLNAPAGNSISLFLKSIIGLVRYLKRSSPQVLLSTVFGANLVAIIAAKCIAEPVFVVIRESSSLRNYSRLKKLLIWFFYPSASQIITVSMAGSRQLNNFLPNSIAKIKVINNGIDVRGVRSLANNLPTDFSTNSSYIVAVGRFVEAKGFDVLISAFARVCAVQEGINLIILGDGPLRELLESTADKYGIRDRVILPGFVKNPYPYIKYAKLFVLSSRWEGFPNVLIEAIALGVRVVATNCDYGPSEILAEDKNAQLVPVDNAAELFEAINTELSRECLGGNAPSSIESFNNEKIFEQYLHLIHG